MAHHNFLFGSISKITFFALALAMATPAVAEEMSLPLHTAGSGTLYLDGMLIGKVNTEMLLDTGSGYVSLSRETFNQVKSDTGTKFLREIRAVMANGKTMAVPVYEIAQLSLGAHCMLYDVEVAVMPNGSRDILGLNALRQLQPLTIQLDPPQLTANCSRAS